MKKKSKTVQKLTARSDTKLHHAIAEVMNVVNDDDRVDAVFRGYRATLHASFPDRQRNKAAGWDGIKTRVQDALLAALKAAHKRGAFRN